MLLRPTAHRNELAEAARLNVWNMLNQFEAAGFDPRHIAAYMYEPSASAQDAFEAALADVPEAEASEVLSPTPERSAPHHPCTLSLRSPCSLH